MTVTPPAYGPAVERWKPWRQLRSMEDVDFALADLPAGFGRGFVAERGDVRVIVIDRKLPPEERLAVLAHEIAHLERGGSGHQPGLSPDMAVTVTREEATVDRIVASRLVPELDLRSYLAQRLSVQEGVEAWEVAEEFGVDDATAARALRLVAEHDRRSA